MFPAAALLALGLFLQVPAPNDSTKATLSLRRERQEILGKEAQSLTKIVDREVAADHLEIARKIRALIDPPPPAGGTRFWPLAQVVPAESTKVNLPKVVQDLRAKTAGELFDLAVRASSPPIRSFSLADSCLRDVIRRNPNHAEARRLLGFLAYKGGWATPHAKAFLERGFVLHPKFGWVDKTWLAHLDAGELPARFDSRQKASAWLPAAQVDTLHENWDKAWKIDTAPHFQLRTNVALADAIAFAGRLEELYELFFAEFADVIGPDSLPLARRFATKTLQPTRTTEKHAVWYFDTKQEYVNYFRTEFQRDETLSLGFYMPPQMASSFRVPPRSYFYRDDTHAIASLATLFHEGSHQILFESGVKSSPEIMKTNFWIWEALGTYFETVSPQPDGSILLGKMTGPRIDSARQRLLERGEFLPIEKLTILEADQFNDLEKDAVYRNYAESMALAIFFLHYKDGLYREEFLDYVADNYRGRNRSRTLAARLDVSFRQLDREFLEYLK